MIEDNNNSVNSIARAMSILDCFAFEQTEWNISDLSKHTGLSLSTLHRQLATLVMSGYLTQDPEKKTYKIGSRLILMSCSLLSKYDLRNITLPYLSDLVDFSGETAHLCQLDGFDMFYVDKVESAHSVICRSRIGSRIPAHVSSAGKVLLAGQNESFIEQY